MTNFRKNIPLAFTPNTKLTLNVPPRAVALYSRSPMMGWYKPTKRIPVIKNLSRLLRDHISGRLIYSGNWDVQAGPVERHKIYARMHDIFQCQHDVTQSQTYKEAIANLKRYGRARIKRTTMRSEEEIRTYIEQNVLGLLLSMKAEGYRADLAPDAACAMVGRDGTVIKTHSGRHRFACARLTRPDDLFPLRIVAIHSDWLGGLTRNDLPQIQQKLDALAQQIAAQQAG